MFGLAIINGLISKNWFKIKYFTSIIFIFLMAASFAGCARKQLPPEQPGYVDAVELKLKCRELADQMLSTVPNDALKGFVAMPVSFVNESNTNESSPLGRLMGESMFYEFNQRGFPTREYRLTGKINVVGGKNDLALAANQVVPTTKQPWAAILVGTYYVDKDATFVNARLVRAQDGLVLRTGQLVIPNTPVVARMTGNGSLASYDSLGYGGTIPIVQGK